MTGSAPVTDGRASQRPRARRLAWLALALALGGALAGLAGAAGSGAGGWPFTTGFVLLRWGFYAAAAGGLLAAVALVWGWRTRARAGLVGAAALVLAVGYCGYLWSWLAVAARVPAIHDVTTDPADPPEFRALALRADNWDSIPDLGDPELAAAPPRERWREVVRRRYGELRPLHLDLPPAQALARVEALARARGWAIARVDPAAGTLEATDTVSLFRFRDDVVVRVRPERGGSRVDVRSVSRVGTSDLGVNAARVRAFLAELSRG